MPRLTGLDHVGLLSTDLDRTLAFYRALGLEILRVKGPDGDGVRSAVVRVGEQELNVFSAPGHVPADRERPVGMHHFCLNADAGSVEELIAELRHAGLEVFRGPVVRKSGVSVFLHDPDGVKVELRIPARDAA
jgi:catechol 2,3-dioxygenase-like lactoylglutathione lyase family enzyme